MWSSPREAFERFPLRFVLDFFRNAEAAAAIGVRPHVLRDARLRGQIQGRKVGKKTVYARDELLKFLAREN